MAGFARTPPFGHRAAAGLLAAWNAVGVYFCYLQVTRGADWMPDATDYDRALFAGLPGWYNYCYALGVGAGLAGAVALLLGRRIAVPLIAVSLAAVVVQFGYMFVATDLIAHKGAAMVIPFPAFIIAVGAVALWGARRAAAKGWAR